ncbi:Translocon at the inner envelope membrane of chloroplasts 32 [Hyphodiscus hymeniophilus]|uniref:Translocon at the inner envelope membrane of chloroplasts 32 n=1 Tax=Hyphodiscus hymeniophilus TaxID=353542 RepID=A0A9P7AYZ1_9HELO|nr:Translocon at the inner envelope membrane of chloroplasts 32 [Hyphodiscus hymeniophilus]
MGKFEFETTGEEVANAFESEIAGKTGSLPTSYALKAHGLGAEAARVIALHRPALIILAGRSLAKAKQTEHLLSEQSPGINTRVLSLDLGSLQSVKEAAAEVNSYSESIDVLINNAGVMAIPRLARTTDGFELQFGTNHLGHFLLTNLIMPKIIAAGPGARIINVSSNGYQYSSVNFEDPNYQSLAQKLGPLGILSYSLDPGEKMMPDQKFKTIGQGAATHIAAAFDPSIKSQSYLLLLAAICRIVAYQISDGNGVFLEHSTPSALAEQSTWLFDESGPQKLWDMSEKLVGQEFRY